MLSLRELIVFTVLLIVPFLVAWRNYMRYTESTFFQMLLGYVSCYFMKNCYALFDRAINGVEKNSSGIDGLAVIAAVLFLAAVISCVGEYPEGVRFGRKQFLFVLCVATVAVLLECAAGVCGNRPLFFVCYICSFLCVCAAVIMVTPLDRSGSAMHRDKGRDSMQSDHRK